MPSTFRKLLSCLTLLLVSNTVQAAGFPDPNEDPFYKVPANVASYPNGHVFNKRLFNTAYPLNVKQSYQYLYRTTDANGKATATVGTVWVPLFPARPPKIVLYGVAEDSLQIDCAPSWGWANSSSNFYFAEKDIQAPTLIPFAVTQGFYVVNTDAEGNNSAVLAGFVEGRSALDGLRGAHNLLAIDNSTSRIASIGYSGGAHTGIWASTLAAAYAPELNFVGGAYGGTPVDLGGIIDAILNTANRAYVAVGLFGLGNAYSSLNTTINGLLTSVGISTSRALRARNFCVPAEDLSFVPQNILSLFKKDPRTVAQVQTILAQNSLLNNVSTLPVPVPTFPRLHYHGTNDTLVPYTTEAQYVQQQCASSPKPNIRFVSIQGADHGPAAIQGLLGALSFVAQALNDKLPDNQNCGSPTTMIAPKSSQALNLLGQSLYDNFTRALAASEASAAWASEI